jgi:hypothetical protein
MKSTIQEGTHGLLNISFSDTLLYSTFFLDLRTDLSLSLYVQIQ